MNISIGRLARRAGVKVATIRYYEEVGLLAETDRAQGHQSRYGAADVARLNVIRHARELGFDMGAIRDLLAMTDHPDASCLAADVIARAHLADIDSKIARLTALRREVGRMVEACAHGRAAECRVIETLAHHEFCEAEHHQTSPVRAGLCRGGQLFPRPSMPARRTRWMNCRRRG